MTVHNALGEFLRSHRARLAPSDLDLPDFGPRRVPGLRREEVASIAGLSSSYYTRIEQGASRAPSESVLDSLATALRLNSDERAHLHRLASPLRHASHGRSAPGPLVPSVAGLLHALPMPAAVLGRSLDILDWNSLGHALLADLPNLHHDRNDQPPGNFAELVLGSPGTEQRFLDVDKEAKQLAGYLRLQTARHPTDAELHELTDRLSRSCPEFARHWNEHVVTEPRPITTRIRHTAVGDLSLRRQALRAASNPDELLVLFHAQPGTPDEASLERLERSVSGANLGTASVRPSVGATPEMASAEESAMA